VDDVQAVLATSVALMLIPRSLFKRLEGFDPGYRLHAEDLDLCRGARLAGATDAVVDGVRVLHGRGVSSRAGPLFVDWHKHRGLLRYFRKFESGRRGPVVRAAVYVSIWLRFAITAVKVLRGRGQQRTG